MIKKYIFSALFLGFLMTNTYAQKTIQPKEIINIKPVLIKFDESLTDRNCAPYFNNSIKQDSLKNILSFHGKGYNKEAQVDPQVAVGGNYVLHMSNAGVSVYDKNGNLKKSVHLTCLAKCLDCLDPKIFFDKKNDFFGFGVWDNISEAEKFPMRLAFSQSNNPLLSWNMYNIPAPYATDGGSIGYGEKWILYRFDGQDDDKYNHAFVMNSQDVKNGKSTNAYVFDLKIGQPLYNQDNGKAYAVTVNQELKQIFLQVIEENNGVPCITELWRIKNKSKYKNYPRFSAQKGSVKKVSSGDFRPKNGVLQGNSVWLSHAVDKEGYSAIEWFQLSLKNGDVLQKGLLAKKGSNYMQPTIAVNQRGDMAIGFQETNKNMYISTRMAYRLANDPVNETRNVINIEEGNSSYEHYDMKGNNLSWGDYSSTVVDGDNGIDFWSAQSYSKDNSVKINVFRLKL